MCSHSFVGLGSGLHWTGLGQSIPVTVRLGTVVFIHTTQVCEPQKAHGDFFSTREKKDEGIHPPVLYVGSRENEILKTKNK